MAGADKNKSLNIVLAYILSVVLATVLSSMLRWLGAEWVYFLDIYLVFALVHSIRKAPMPSLIYGLLLGLAQDVYGGSLIGLNSLSKMILAYTVSSLKDVFLIRGLLQRVFAIGLAVIVDHYIRAAVLTIFNLPSEVAFQNLLVASGLNMLAAIAILLYKQAIDKREQQVKSYEKS